MLGKNLQTQKKKSEHLPWNYLTINLKSLDNTYTLGPFIWPLLGSLSYQVSVGFCVFFTKLHFSRLSWLVVHMITNWSKMFHSLLHSCPSKLQLQEEAALFLISVSFSGPQVILTHNTPRFQKIRKGWMGCCGWVFCSCFPNSFQAKKVTSDVYKHILVNIFCLFFK